MIGEYITCPDKVGAKKWYFRILCPRTPDSRTLVLVASQDLQFALIDFVNLTCTFANEFNNDIFFAVTKPVELFKDNVDSSYCEQSCQVSASIGVVGGHAHSHQFCTCVIVDIGLCPNWLCECHSHRQILVKILQVRRLH